MIAIQRYPRKRWASILSHYGCKPADDMPKRDDGEFWRWPWPHAWGFFVPLDDHGGLDTWALIHILQGMREKAPDGWKFPPPP